MTLSHRQAHYKFIAFAGNRFYFYANRYLEKLFPFVFKLPELQQGDISWFVKLHVNQLPIDVTSFLKEKNLTEDQFIRDIARGMRSKVFYNPRLIKRGLNILGLVLNGAEWQESHKINLLVTWIMMILKWPTSRHLILNFTKEDYQKYINLKTSTRRNTLDALESVKDRYSGLDKLTGFYSFISSSAIGDIDLKAMFTPYEILLKRVGV